MNRARGFTGLEAIAIVFCFSAVINFLYIVKEKRHIDRSRLRNEEICSKHFYGRSNGVCEAPRFGYYKRWYEEPTLLEKYGGGLNEKNYK